MDIGQDSITDNTNRNFKGQQKNEMVLCFCRKHWIILLPYFIGMFVFISAVAGFLFFVPRELIGSLIDQMTYRIFAFVGLIGFTYYLHGFFYRILNYYLQTMIITNYRIVNLDQTLFFRRVRDSIDLSEIQDVEIKQNGIVETLFDYGEIIITLSAGPLKTLYCLPNPEYHFRKINKTKREYINLRRAGKGLSPPEGNSHQF